MVNSMHKKASFACLALRRQYKTLSCAKKGGGFLCVGSQFFGALSRDLSMHPPTAFPTAMHTRNLSYKAMH